MYKKDKEGNIIETTLLRNDGKQIEIEREITKLEEFVYFNSKDNNFLLHLGNAIQAAEQNKEDETVIMLLCNFNQTEILKEIIKKDLIENYALNSSLTNSKNLLEWACEKGYMEIVEELLKKDKIKEILKNDDNSLNIALKERNIEIAEKLLGFKDINVNNENDTIETVQSINRTIISFSPLTLALIINKEEKVISAKEKNENGNYKIEKEIKADTVIDKLFEKGATINNCLLYHEERGFYKGIFDEQFKVIEKQPKSHYIENSKTKSKEGISFIVEDGNNKYTVEIPKETKNLSDLEVFKYDNNKRINAVNDARKNEILLHFLVSTDLFIGTNLEYIGKKEKKENEKTIFEKAEKFIIIKKGNNNMER